MPIVLLRVDERLVHGQVVVGWGNHLHPDRIAVVDDELATSPWEQELYGLGLPGSLEITFASVDDARDALPDWRADAARTFVLTRDVATMRRLAADGALVGAEVNLGGIHYAPGRTAVLPYLHLSDAERDEIRSLAGAGVRIEARDLPASRSVDLAHLLRSRQP